jgi:hypothetical protein
VALKARDEIHQQQITAGTIGRKNGHKFEAILTDSINNMFLSISFFHNGLYENGITQPPITHQSIYK